jgi:hypothetical protein
MLSVLADFSGLGLIGLSLAWLIHQVFPPKLVQIPWQLTAINALGQAAFLALLGLLLLLLAQRVQDQLDRRRFRRVILLRRMALFAIPVLLFCMPLQIVAGMRLQSLNSAQQLQQPLRIKSAAVAIAKAETSQALGKALAQFPGAPPQLKDLLNKPLPQARALVLQALNPQISQAEDYLKALLKAQSRHNWISQILLSLNFLALALGYSTIAQASPGRPTLFQQVVWFPIYLFTGRAGPGQPARHPLPERWIQALQIENERSSTRSSRRAPADRPGAPAQPDRNSQDPNLDHL